MQKMDLTFACDRLMGYHVSALLLEILVFVQSTMFVRPFQANQLLSFIPTIDILRA